MPQLKLKFDVFYDTTTYLFIPISCFAANRNDQLDIQFASILQIVLTKISLNSYEVVLKYYLDAENTLKTYSRSGKIVLQVEKIVLKKKCPSGILMKK